MNEQLPELTGDDVAGAEGAGAVLPEVLAAAAGDQPRRRGLGLGAWLAIAWLVLVIGLAVLAPVLPLQAPAHYDAALARHGPGAGHLLGVDGLGHDMVSRLTYGARNSLVVGFGAVLIGGTIGGFLGLMAGYYRGRIETVIVGLLDVMLAFPALVLALALTIFLGRTLFNVTLALGIIATPTLARIARANTITWSQREFVVAARAQGAKNGRIIRREVLPNVLPAVASIALLAVAVVIVAEAGLSLLGAGLDVSKPTWGNIIAIGRGDLTNGSAPHIVFDAAGAIFLTVLSLNYLGDAVRARFDVREGRL